MDEINERIRKILEEKGKCTVSIDGRCASGKSTLGRKIASDWQGTLIHLDDFFLRPEQRTPQRYATPGENVDHERFLEEVLVPLKEGRAFSFHPFRHEIMGLSDEVIHIDITPVTVIEGSYSQRDDLRPYYDLNIAIQIDPETQKERLRKRSPERYQMFIDRWIPLEEMYFAAYPVYENADIVLQADR